MPGTKMTYLKVWSRVHPQRLRRLTQTPRNGVEPRPQDLSDICPIVYRERNQRGPQRIQVDPELAQAEVDQVENDQQGNVSHDFDVDGADPFQGGRLTHLGAVGG